MGGAAATAPIPSTVVPMDATKSYATTTPALCEVNSSSGAVTGKDNGNCTVKLTLSRNGYTDKTHDYTVTINEGTIAVDGWGSYAASKTVGDAAIPAPDLVGVVPSGASKILYLELFQYLYGHRGHWSSHWN